MGVVTQFYQHEVKSFVANKQASIITISMKSSVPKKAEDVINTLIAVYEKDAIDDKRGIAESTGQFIDNRLEIISEELSEVDRNIENSKKTTKYTISYRKPSRRLPKAPNIKPTASRWKTRSE